MMPGPATSTGRKKAVNASEAAAAADELLQEIGGIQAGIRAITNRVAAEIEAVRERHRADLEALKARLAASEKGLLALARRARGALFADRDRIDLPHGSLLHQVEERVRRARGVLEAMEAALERDPEARYIAEAIKIAKAVDWDRLEQWSPEQLAAVGTEKARKELFTYEIRNSQ